VREHRPGDLAQLRRSQQFRRARGGHDRDVRVDRRCHEYGILRSEDGINWLPPSVPPIPTGENLVDEFGNVHFNATGEVFAFSSGWVWLSGPQTEFALWTSLDGDVWEQADTSDIPVPFWAQLNLFGDRSDGGRQGSSGEVIFIRQNVEVGESQQTSTLWIIEIGP